MNSKDTTWGSDPERLAEMVGMGAGADCQDLRPDEAREDLLGRQLRATLPLTQKEADELAVFVGEMRDRLPLQGRALGEVLLDEETELGILSAIKEHGKVLSQSTDSEAERDVGLTIYFAAIAGAILFHDHRITSYSYAALADAFERLVHKRWMNPKLARHFAKARAKCRKMAR
ncbi:MAG TPA: hypothetical protein VFH61_11855 [Thermoleophilia bacterium]|nr:hypothetical protein [Thermoleophilia bacterium]